MSDKLKDLCVSLRDVALTGRKVVYCAEIPIPIQKWLRRLCVEDVHAILAFTRCARALPTPSRGRVSEGLYNHAKNIAERHVCHPLVEESIEEYVATRFRSSLRHRTWIHPPNSKNAVKESSGSRGGYDEYLRDLITEDLHGDLYRVDMEGRILEAARRCRPFPGKDSLLNRLLKVARAGPFDESTYPEFLQGYGTLLSMEKFGTLGETYENVPVHVATPISEQGCKVRVITVPPACVFTAGDLVRKAVFPRLRKDDRRIADFQARRQDDGRVRGFAGSLRGGQSYLSADLTKATDGFYHGAIKAVLRGLGKAGLPDLYLEAAAQSLGVGQLKHYVRYHQKSFTETHWQEVLLIPGIIREEVKGEKCVRVPMERGCLMGTPLSFTILSLLNGWACVPLGPNTALCGDDVLSVTREYQVKLYSERVVSIGSGLHSKKSFWGTKGWTFCEVFGIAEGDSGKCHWYNPYPLKQFMRDGNGVMDKGNYAPSQWKRLRRVARVLCKEERAKARRLRRPPELPTALGGLGHPSNRVGDVPKIVRAQLHTLLFGAADPSKYARRVDVFFSPADPRQYEMVRDGVGAAYEYDLAYKFEAPPTGSVYVPNRVLRAQVARLSHELYWALGGHYKPSRPKAMKPGTLKLPLPSSTPITRNTGWSLVAGWWKDKLEEEGKFVPIDVALEFRGYTPPSAAAPVR
jgi:hypothetical protein